MSQERRKQLEELLWSEYDFKEELEKRFLLPLTPAQLEELDNELEKLTNRVLTYINELSSLYKELALSISPSEKYVQLNRSTGEFVPFIPPSSTNFSDAYHQEAKNYINAGDYRQAVKTFRQALEADAERADYYEGCGDIYGQWGNILDEATPSSIENFDWNLMTTFQRLEEIDLKDVSDPVDAEDCFLRAIKNYHRALEIDPSSHTSYYKRALTYASLKDYMSALAELERAIALEPELEYYLKYKEWKEVYYQWLIENLKDKNNQEKWRHLSDLGSLGTSQSRLNLIAVWNKRLYSYPPAALTRLGQRAVEPLIEALKDTDSRVRSQAASDLGRLGDYRAVEPLVKALKDEKYEVRYNAVNALGQLGDNRAVEPLVEALKDEDSKVRYNAANVLAKLGDKRAVEPLVEALKNGEVMIRFYAASALEYIRDSQAVEPLIEALKDGEALVRRSAAMALRNTADSRAVEALIEALKDESEDVRCNASLALGMLGDSRAVEPLLKVLKDEKYEVRFHAIYALSLLGDKRATEPVLAALNDESEWVRQSAATALSQLGDSRGVEYMLNVLNKNTFDDEAKLMHAHAVQALGEIGDNRALSALEEIYQNDKGDTPNQKIIAKAIAKIKAKNGLT